MHAGSQDYWLSAQSILPSREAFVPSRFSDDYHGPGLDSPAAQESFIIAIRLEGAVDGRLHDIGVRHGGGERGNIHVELERCLDNLAQQFSGRDVLRLAQFLN